VLWYYWLDDRKGIQPLKILHQQFLKTLEGMCGIQLLEQSLEKVVALIIVFWAFLVSFLLNYTCVAVTLNMYCRVCKNGVGNRSVLCITYQKWVQKWCSSVKGSLYKACLYETHYCQTFMKYQSRRRELCWQD